MDQHPEKRKTNADFIAKYFAPEEAENKSKVFTTSKAQELLTLFQGLAGSYSNLARETGMEG
jgi:hypothetical protein